MKKRIVSILSHYTISLEMVCCLFARTDCDVEVNSVHVQNMTNTILLAYDLPSNKHAYMPVSIL